MSTKPIYREEMGKLIRRERLRQGLQIVELARMAGMAESNVRNVERGGCPSVVHAHQLLEALGVSMRIGAGVTRLKVE